MAHATTTGKSAHITTTPTPGSIEAALRAILAEVAPQPGQRPYDGDSYLPAHLVEAARTALAQVNDTASVELAQTAFNSLSVASWHIARNEPQKALARIRRAQAHVLHGMEGGAA